MKRVAVFGSTGTIGKNTLDLIRTRPDYYQVLLLTAHSNLTELIEQIRAFHPKAVCVGKAEHAEILAKEFSRLEIYFGKDGLLEAAKATEFDIAVMGIVGFAALEPTLEICRSGRVLALANKESLVVAGSLVKKNVEWSGTKLIPLDSEHCSLYQLLEAQMKANVKTLAITASGGPLFKNPEVALEAITPEFATNHPIWKMGPKISVDSATLMNKGLEVIEAHFLFGYDVSQIEVWIHPQSIVHGAIQLKDHSWLASLYKPDMKGPIGYALAWPERFASAIAPLGLKDLAKLEFFEPDMKRFPALEMCFEVLKQSDAHRVALNAANEVAVGAFLERKISFTKITSVVSEVLQKTQGECLSSLESILDADARARGIAQEYLMCGVI